MRMERLVACPGCGSDALQAVFPYNDLRYLERRVDPDFARSDFVICRGCGLMFASRRQAAEDFGEYYTRFAEWESRTYAVYPPPAKFIHGKAQAAVEITRALVEQALLHPGGRVLHIRADGGALLARLRDHHGVTDVYGLDVFDTNRRFARERYRLQNVEPLIYGDFAIPFGSVSFDLIVSNHLLTHACRPRDALMALRDRLRPGGAVFLYNEQDHMLAFTRGASFLRDGINNFHKQLFTEETLLALLRLSGAKGNVVGHRNTSPLVVARRAAPLAAPELPPNHYAPYFDAFRAWAEAHEHRWQRQHAQRLWRKNSILGVLRGALRRAERRLLGRAPSP
jgi:SAM-dependent methyltransferase